MITGLCLFVAAAVAGVGFWYYSSYSKNARYDKDYERSSILYIDAVALQRELGRSKNLADVHTRLLEKYVEWIGFVVETTQNGFIIQPRREDPLDDRERAFVGLRDRRKRPAFGKGERVKVYGMVSRFDADVINIAGATIVED